MPTHIRLSRVGRNKQAAFRIVVSDSMHARDGRLTEQIGHYNPRLEPARIELDAERALHWLRTGAKPSDTVVSLFRQTGVWKTWTDEQAGREPSEPAAFAAPAEPAPAESTAAEPRPAEPAPEG